MDWILLVFFILTLTAALALSIVLLYYFQDDEDDFSRRKLFLMIVIVCGWELAWYLLLLVPSDVYLTATGGGFESVFWRVGIWMTLLFSFVLAPFAIQLYNSYDDPLTTSKKSFIASVFYTALLTGSVAVTLTALFFIFRQVTVNIDASFCSRGTEVFENGVVPIPTSNDSSEAAGNSYIPFVNVDTVSEICALFLEAEVTTVSFNTAISLSSYVWSSLSFLGCCLYCLLGAVGLVALPYSLLAQFITRPKRIGEDYHRERQKELAEKALVLKDCGEALKTMEADLVARTGWKQKRRYMKLQQIMNRYRKDIYILEEEARILNVCYKEKGENPIISYGKLLLSFVTGTFSIVWIVQIILTIILPSLITIDFIKFPYLRLLDEFLVQLSNMPLAIFAILFYVVLVIYQFLCIFYGTSKMASNVFFCLPASPLRRGKTLLNALGVDTILLLLASFGAVTFTQQSFSEYSRWTSSSLQFEVYTVHTIPFRYLFDPPVFAYAYLVMALLTLAYMLIMVKMVVIQVGNFAPVDAKVLAKSSKFKQKLADRAAVSSSKTKSHNIFKSAKNIISEQSKIVLAEASP